MLHETEFHFLEKALKKLHLNVNSLSRQLPPDEPLDLGIRQSLGWDEEYHRLLKALSFPHSRQAIYKITDRFLGNYVFLPLPDGQSTTVVIGPYLTVLPDRQQLQKETAQRGMSTADLRQLESYYDAVPVISDETFLMILVGTFGETVWDSSSFSVIELTGELTAPLHLHHHSEAPFPGQALPDMQAMEHRYAYENEILRAVELGQLHRALKLLSNISSYSIEQRSSDAVRNPKSYCIIMNTLLRKAAEKGGVHPLYIHRVSSEFAAQIEATTTREDFTRLWLEMAEKYCLLVRKHTTSSYCPLIQKVITRIDFDLAADLSLKATAESLNINASYLSALFKNETGTTLTDYVNKKRMTHAAYLLTTTHMSISAIALSCGIQDDNYFTKVFKKYFQTTPKQFRLDNDKFKMQ